MFYQLNKGEDYDINGTNLKNWLSTYKTNLTNLILEDNGKATIINLTNLCDNFSNLQNVNFADFNGSNVTECYGMFNSCYNITNINGLNLPNCSNFDYAFSACNNLTTFPIKPETFKDNSSYINMYDGCTNITEDISDININNCILDNMFSNCFNVTKIYNISISNSVLNKPFINMSNVTDVYNITLNNCSWMSDLFKNAFKLQNIYNFNIDISNVTGTNLMNFFYGCNNLSDESYAVIANALPMALYIKSPQISTIGLNVDRFDLEQLKILGNKLYEEAISYAVNLSNVSNYWNIYDGSTWTNIEKHNYDITGTNLRLNISKTATDIYIEDVGNEGTLYYAKDLFSGRSKLKTINISNLKTEKVTATSNMFRSCNNLISISDFDVSNVFNSDSMFWGCQNLVSLPNFDDLHVRGSMSSMFVKCSNLTTMPNFDTSNARSMGWTFSGCTNLTVIPNFDTSNVSQMANAFYNCFNLTTIPNFDISNVTNSEAMFSGCNNLTEIPNYDTSKVTSMRYMFSGCTNLTFIPNFNTSKVRNMFQMFSSCNNLVEIPQFNTSNIINITRMFNNCNNLSNASIQNIINMCLNSNITNSTLMNLNNTNNVSPLYNTIFDNTYYSNRLAELTAAGWSY